jgi:hypothetical protein
MCLHHISLTTFAVIANNTIALIQEIKKMLYREDKGELQNIHQITAGIEFEGIYQ